jgi:hypothetical protein
MLLNDVHREEERLAYLLGLSTERYIAPGKSRSVVRMALAGAVIVLLLAIWLLAGVL